MRVLILVGNRYPATTAFAGRMQKFARGLMAAGADVLVMGQRLPDEKTPESGIDAFGVPYGTVLAGFRNFKEKILRRKEIVVATLDAAEKELSSRPYDAVIAYGQGWLFFNQAHAILTGFLRICRQHGAVCLMDCTEWFPLEVTRLWTGVWWGQFRMLHSAVPKLDGIVGISRFWSGYAQKHNLPILHIPALGEAEPCQPPPPRREGPFRLTFLGRMLKRDLPDTMLESVRLALRSGQDVRLVAVGDVDSSPSGRDARRRVANDLELRDRVVFTGYVSSEEVQRRLLEADALVLVRNNTRFERACFPTRLPEYLRTGRPVILGDSGDMAKYFKHRKSVWFVPTGHCPQAIADAISALARDPDLGRQIGLGGQQVALREFNYREHGRRLMEFIHERRQVLIGR